MISNKVIEKFLNLNNVGLIKNASGIGVNFEETCKNTYKIYLEIDNQKIVDAKFKAFGSPNFVDVCDDITELVKNCTIDEALSISSDQIKEIISNYNLEKQFSPTFFASAIESSIKDFRKKEIKKLYEEK